MSSRSGSSKDTPSKSIGPLTPGKAGGGTRKGDEIQFVEDDAIEVVSSDDEDSSTVKTSFKSKITSMNSVQGDSVSTSGTIPLDTSIESMPSSLQHESINNGLDSLLDTDLSPEELEEKERLIHQVLELQNTLDDLSHRVDSVKEENLKLKSENQVLAQYIENLMSASSVFQSTSSTTSSSSNSNGNSSKK